MLRFNRKDYETGNFDVETRNGKPATQGVRFNADTDFPWRFVVDGEIHSYNDNGVPITRTSQHELILFKKPREAFIITYLKDYRYHSTTLITSQLNLNSELLRINKIEGATEIKKHTVLI